MSTFRIFIVLVTSVLVCEVNGHPVPDQPSEAVADPNDPLMASAYELFGDGSLFGQAVLAGLENPNAQDDIWFFPNHPFVQTSVSPKPSSQPTTLQPTNDLPVSQPSAPCITKTPPEPPPPSASKSTNPPSNTGTSNFKDSVKPITTQPDTSKSCSAPAKPDTTSSTPQVGPATDVVNNTVGIGGVINNIVNNIINTTNISMNNVTNNFFESDDDNDNNGYYDDQGYPHQYQGLFK